MSNNQLYNDVAIKIQESLARQIEGEWFVETHDDIDEKSLIPQEELCCTLAGNIVVMQVERYRYLGTSYTGVLGLYCDNDSKEWSINMSSSLSTKVLVQLLTDAGLS